MPSLATWTGERWQRQIVGGHLQQQQTRSHRASWERRHRQECGRLKEESRKHPTPWLALLVGRSANCPRFHQRVLAPLDEVAHRGLCFILFHLTTTTTVVHPGHTESRPLRAFATITGMLGHDLRCLELAARSWSCCWSGRIARPACRKLA